MASVFFSRGVFVYVSFVQILNVMGKYYFVFLDQ